MLMRILWLGRYYCLDDDWKKGLPHLAKGSDAPLRQLAEQDLASPKETIAQIGLADAWWTLGEARQGEEADVLLLRAGYWYDRARGQLTSGFNRLKVEKRLEELVEIRQHRAAHPLTLAKTRRRKTSGTALVLKPGRVYNQIAKNKIENVVMAGHWAERQERFVASPVFDGNRLYFRGEGTLYAIGPAP